MKRRICLNASKQMNLPKRNAPCPCGSGYKAKRCCLVKVYSAKQAAIARAYDKEPRAMTNAEIRTEAKALNDFVLLAPHEGRTKEYFDDKAISANDQMRIMEASVRLTMTRRA